MDVIGNSLKHSLDNENLEANKRLCTEPAGTESLCLNKSQTNNRPTTGGSPFVRVSELDVGITEYMSDLPGFNAVIKERYSDFIVNEIDTEGNVVKLTNLLKPRNPERDYQVDGLLDDETVKNLEELVADDVSEVKIEVTDKDKDTRKDIHVAIRKMFDGIESSTVDRGAKKFIIVKKMNNKKGRRFQLSVGGNYLHFVLYKENRDTMETVNSISSFLRVLPKSFSYAGSKDKRGKTSQLVSAYKITPDKLLSINEEFSNVRVGNIVYKSEQLKLGDLWGNRFVIVLRQLNGTPDDVGKAVESLSTKGFVNYYGLQRFGTSSVPTHSIGRALLCSDWQHAIDLILTPRPEDDDELTEAKHIWSRTHNANLALKNLRRKWSIEAKLLCGLAAAHAKDFLNALGAVPRNMRLMYLHSYQSFIWNKVASKRIKEHGLKVLTGDLVPVEKGVLVDNCTEGESSRKAMLNSIVKYISEDEVDKYDISDVVLPLPGHSVLLPKNETKDWYDDFLKEDGMSWSNFDSKVKSLSLSGAYRKLLVIPADLKWEIIPYADVTKPLALSDLDLLHGTTLPLIDESGPLKALKLEFQLPPSAYATMAIREVTKQSTCYVSKT